MKIIVAMVLCMFGFATQAQTNTCSKSDLKRIKSATQGYVAKNSAIAAKDIKLTSAQCANSYASAVVHSKKRTTDDSTIYLHKVKKHWTVLSMGTSFDEKFLAKIPEAIRVK